MRAVKLVVVMAVGACAQASLGPPPPDGDRGRADMQDPSGHTLAVSVTGNGTVSSTPSGITCGSDCTETFSAGTTVTLTATAGAGMAFAGWSGACTGALPTCNVTMDDAKTATAAFAPSFCATSQFDRFDVANTTTLAGWTERLGNWEVASMAARQDQTGGVYTHYMTFDASTQTDGCASVSARFNTTSTGMTVQSVGVVLRWTSPNSYVVGLVQDNTGAGQFDTLYIYQYPNGTMLGNLASQTFGTSPRLKMCITGGNVTLSVDAANDGVFETMTTATTNLAGPGLAGLMTHTFSVQPSVDDFCVGS